MKNIMIFLIAASVGYLHQESVLRSGPGTVQSSEQTIRISASTFEFTPSEITVKKGVPVVLELISKDRHHGFKVAEFHLRADVQPGTTEKVRFIPDKTGTFTFFCDVFCGGGHEDMSGILKVTE
ncbi:MAG TPA: cupredoxin domain-containing protein [Terriglobia bacterium]|nr:cupredoxin domain-containing protein [Terriglobia bacterium]